MLLAVMRTYFFLLFLAICTSVKAQIVNDSIHAKKLAEVEISAQIKPSTLLSSSSLQVITSQTILDQGIQSVSDAVRRFNGVVLKDYGGIGGLKTISIRGMGAEHTAISYDGIMVSNMQSGQVDLGRFALDNISAISLNIGQSDDIFQTARAMASVGVLNLQTIIPQFTNRNYKGFVCIKTGSFGLFNPILDYNHKLNNTFTLSANSSWQRADGKYPFKMMNGKTAFEDKRRNSDVSIYRTEINLYSNFGKSGKLNTKLYYFDSERGLPNAVDFQNNYRVERLWNRNFFVQTVYNTSINKRFKFKSQVKYDYNYTRYRDVHDLYDKGEKVDIYKQQEVYWSNTLLYMFDNNISISLAEDLSFNKLKDETPKFGGIIFRPERYSSLTALAAQYKTSRLTVNTTLLATYINEEVKGKKIENTYKKLSPAISFSFAPLSAYHQFRIRASYKDIFRIPTFTEAFYTRSLSIIKPESAKQINAGLVWIGNIPSESSNYISISVDGYYNKVKDKIIIQPSTFYPYTTNLGKVDITGVDIKVSTGIEISNSMGVDVSGSYSYTKALDITNNEEDSYKNQILYTPKNSGAVSAVFKNPWLNLSYSVLITGERYFWHQNIPKYKMDGYQEHSIGLNKQLKIKDFNLLLQTNIINLWNKHYEVIRRYPMPGRSFNISMSLKY